MSRGINKRPSDVLFWSGWPDLNRRPLRPEQHPPKVTTREFRHRRRIEAPLEARSEPLGDVHDHDRLPVGSQRTLDWSVLVIDKQEGVSIPGSTARASQDGTFNRGSHADQRGDGLLVEFVVADAFLEPVAGPLEDGLVHVGLGIEVPVQEHAGDASLSGDVVEADGGESGRSGGGIRPLAGSRRVPLYRFRAGPSRSAHQVGGAAGSRAMRWMTVAGGNWVRWPRSLRRRAVQCGRRRRSPRARSPVAHGVPRWGPAGGGRRGPGAAGQRR